MSALKSPALFRSLCLYPPDATNTDVAKTFYLKVPKDRDPEEMLNQKFGAVVAKVTRLWTNGSGLTYCFIPTHGVEPGERQIEKVEECMREWEKYGNFTFRRITNPEDANIRIELSSEQGCWSYIGTGDANQVDKTKPTMNITNVTLEDDFEDEERGNILHELGHAIGLLHEHQRPAEDDGKSRELVAAATEEFFAKPEKGGWTARDVKDQILATIPLPYISNFSEVDKHSIMLYNLPLNITKGLGLPDDVAMQRNYKLSETDKAFVRINYPYLAPKQPPESASQWTMEYALDLVGLTEQEAPEVRKKILKSKDGNNIRKYFSEWCISKRTGKAKASEVVGA